jgi:hypothetical protein
MKKRIFDKNIVLQIFFGKKLIIFEKVLSAKKFSLQKKKIPCFFKNDLPLHGFSLLSV